MPGSFPGIVDAFGFSELAQEGMPQHMGGDINFFILGEMGIGLGGDTEDDAIRFSARELSAGTRHKEGRGVVLPYLEPFVQDLARVPMHRHEVPDDPAFGLHVGKSLADVLVPLQM